MIWKDIRYSIRSLLKQPGFTVVAVITLALGIGANTAIFTVVNATLLRSLPYREPDRLYHLWETTPRKDFNQREASYPDFLDWRNNTTITLAAYTGGDFTLSGRGPAEHLYGAGVSGNFFTVLGVEPLRGRFFSPEEEQPNAGRVVVLSYGLWQRLFGGDERIVGEAITLNTGSYTVIGILPQNFHFALRGAAELWVPLSPSQTVMGRRFMHWVNVIGRLNNDASLEQAQAEMAAIGERIAGEYADSHTGTGIKLIPLNEQITGAVSPILFVLLGAVGFVLLIACANVANLLLARSAARQKEVAIRLALGATRARLVRQFLTESTLLALLGGSIGIFLAMWGVEALIAAIPTAQLYAMPYLRGLRIDSGILIFTTTLSFLTGITFGFVPALQTAKADVQTALKEGGKSSTMAIRQRFRNALIVSEIALALVLLIGAGLMLKSTLRLLQVNLGFNAEHLINFQAALPPGKYTDNNKLNNFHKELLARIEATPGISGAATVDIPPMAGGNTTHFLVEGQPPPKPGDEPESNVRGISAGYFHVMQTPIIEGREFTERDNLQSPGEVIINQTLAKKAFPNQSPVGQRVTFANDNSPPAEIVGVVGDEKVSGLDKTQTGVIYYPCQQSPDPTMSIVVRSTNSPELLFNTIRQECQSLDSDFSIYGMRTMEQVINDSPATFTRRYPAFLISLFAATAVVLAVVGIYGAMSYVVTQRRQELGVRIALGARMIDVLKLIVKQGMSLAIVGIGTGLLAAFLLTRMLESLLFGVSATDAFIFITVPLIIAGVALAACLIPAFRATRTDPMIALRSE